MRRIVAAAIAATVASQAADLGTTLFDMLSGVGREANPLLAPLPAGGIAAVKVAVAASIILSLLKLPTVLSRAASVAALAGALAVVAVAAHNLTLA